MLRKIGNIIGIIGLFQAIIDLFRYINDKTKTELISPEMFHYLSNHKNADKLTREVDHYKRTGKWRHDKLDLIGKEVYNQPKGTFKW